MLDAKTLWDILSGVSSVYGLYQMGKEGYKWVTNIKKHRITVTMFMESKGVKRAEVMHTDDRKSFLCGRKEHII